MAGCVLLAMIAGCSASSTGTAEKTAASKATTDAAKTEGQQNGSDSASSEETKAEKQELAKVINKPGKVQNKGGYIKILVNNDPITNFDIQRRAKFLKLRRVGGNRSKVAENELIEQSLKLAEAKRVNLLVSDAMVDGAFASFAKQNRTTPKKLAADLGRLGVGASHFKNFIKTQMSWQTFVQKKFQAETTQKTEVDVVTRLRKSGSDKPQLTEYNFQQVVFVVPEAKRKDILASRRSEAKAFLQRFTGCENTLESAKALRDVSVIEHRRVMEPELPDTWRSEMIDAAAGKKTTRVKDTPKGVEFIAICSTRQVDDDRAAQVASQSAEFDNFNTKGSEVAQGYLDELRTRATIVYR